ncbi:MAG: AAA family ATPase, partial [Candidatus Bilamarchaeaceae archaeon]
MISSIRLRNWRSHEDSSLQFSRGSNLLIGIMGSGKSSVLDAMSFALFGTTPLVEKRKQSLEDIVRSGEPSASVSLEFQWNGSKFLVERSIEKESAGRVRSDAKLYENGKLLEKGPRAVTQRIADLIRVDYSLFSRAIYSEQNNIDYFMNVDAGRRKEEMDRLLGLDRFESARSGCGKILNAIKDRTKNIRLQYSPDEVQTLR